MRAASLDHHWLGFQADAEAAIDAFLDRARQRHDLGAAGFTVEKERDRRAAALAFFQQVRERAAKGEVPRQVAMGASAPQKSANLARLVAEGTVAPAEIISRRR